MEATREDRRAEEARSEGGYGIRTDGVGSRRRGGTGVGGYVDLVFVICAVGG